MKARQKFFPIVTLLLAAVLPALADNPTAFSLIKLGDPYVGVQSKDKVVQIRSEKSAGSLTPDIWYVVYYDPDATLKAVQVKFSEGRMLDVSHPLRLLEPITGDDAVLDSSKFKVDSDKAIEIATGQPLLKNLKLTATQLWLQHGDTGPQWQVKVWAEKLYNPSQETDVGDVIISADDGSIIKIDLHPDSVN